MSDAYDSDLELEDEPLEEADEDLEDQTEDEDEPVDEPEEEDEPAPAAARQPSRGDRRIQNLARDRKELQARLDAQAQELNQLRQQFQAVQQPQQPQMTEAQLVEQLRQMDPVDAARYLVTSSNQIVQGELARIRWEATEAADRTSFDSLCAREPSAQRMKAEVEQRLQTLRSQGTNISREALYTHLLGEKARANATRATGRAQKNATANTARQTARPSAGRGDAASEGRGGNNSAQARARRLQNIQL